jgi:hypothetical protein
MPHGIEAIKQHIQTVDNVPLLVSLFTDATPHTIKSMLEIFREYGEVVLAVGASYRSYNQHIYASANISTSVSCLPSVLPCLPAEEKDLLTLFPVYSTNSLTRADLRLSFDLVGLGTVNLLQLRSLDPALLLAPILNGSNHGGNGSTDIPHVHLSVLLETVRKGRVLLLNKFQALAFIVVYVVGLACWNITAQLLPMSVAPSIPPPLAVVYSIVYLPALSLSMLFNDDHENVMKNTPRKSNLVLRPRDSARFYNYLATRVLAVCLGVYVTGFFAAASVFKGHKSFYHRLVSAYNSC